MIQTHFGGFHRDQLHRDVVLRYTEPMGEYLGESADNVFFMVAEEPKKHRGKEVTEDRIVSDGKGGTETVSEKFWTQVVRVIPFRWDQKQRLAVKAGNPFEKTIYFAPDTLEHPGIEEQVDVIVARDSSGQPALRVPAPRPLALARA